LPEFQKQNEGKSYLGKQIPDISHTSWNMTKNTSMELKNIIGVDVSKCNTMYDEIELPTKCVGTETSLQNIECIASANSMLNVVNKVHGLNVIDIDSNACIAKNIEHFGLS
jgi:hypothetical protein